MVSSIISHLGRDMHHSIPPLNRDLSNPTRRDRRGSHLPTRIKRNLRKKIRIVQNEKFQLKRSFPPGLGLRRETWSYLGGGQLFSTSCDMSFTVLARTEYGLVIFIRSKKSTATLPRDGSIGRCAISRLSTAKLDHTISGRCIPF